MHLRVPMTIDLCEIGFLFQAIRTQLHSGNDEDTLRNAYIIKEIVAAVKLPKTRESTDLFPPAAAASSGHHFIDLI
jgi:hypothetical protein